MSDDLRAIAKLLEALRPWREHLVIVGGWAHRLHRFHERAFPPAYQPLRTRDVDVALSPTSPLKGNIGDALESAGFQQEFSGEHTPPITHYRLGKEDEGFYAEFLAPLHGSGIRRNGQPDVTVASAGIIAQKLRHLDLLLVQPWTVSLGRTVGIPIDPVEIKIANPVSFIAQKFLIQKDRKREKRPQDVLYIHDTLELFGRELQHLRSVWLDLVRPSLPPKTARNVEQLCREHFAEVNDVIRDAARLPQDRALTPDLILRACRSGLDEVFGPG